MTEKQMDTDECYLLMFDKTNIIFGVWETNGIDFVFLYIIFKQK